MKITEYEKIRYELFEYLFPVLLFTGEEEERIETLRCFIDYGVDYVHDSFEELCLMDGFVYPYLDNDFEVNYFERGGINYVQIILPENIPSEGANNILRAYILYSKKNDTILEYKYFVIVKFAENGQILIINKEGKDSPGLLGHELTEHTGDMEYEYWALANDYAMLMVQKYRKENKKK